MHCIYCFFKDKFQNELKMKDRQFRFELELKEYKKKFIKSLGEVCSCSECINKHKFSKNVLAQFDEVSTDVKSKKEYIAEVFDQIINVYMLYISKNHISAFVGLENFLKKYSNNYTTINTIQMCKPMFRVRPLGSYDKKNICEYFHIPFTKRYNVGNQRYSMTGIPMSYMAETLQIALDEVEKGIEEVNIALFVPRFSCFYQKGMYDVSNTISGALDTIIVESTQNSSISYDNAIYTFSKKNMDKIIADYILYQILQFPTNSNTKGVFIQEYVLPQMMMEMIQNQDGYVGMQYQTSKFREYPNEGEVHKVPNLNYCFFIPYIEENDYNKNLLNDFFFVIYNEDDADINDEKLQQRIDSCHKHCKEAQSKLYLVDEYRHYITQVEMYIKKTTLINLTYDKSKVYKVERALFYKFLGLLDEIISNPEKNNFMKIEA